MLRQIHTDLYTGKPGKTGHMEDGIEQNLTQLADPFKRLLGQFRV
jgi:hypothetical protein